MSADPSSRTLGVSDPQEMDAALVSTCHRTLEDQGVVGQREGVASASVGHGRKTPGCRNRKWDELAGGTYSILV